MDPSEAASEVEVGPDEKLHSAASHGFICSRISESHRTELGSWQHPPGPQQLDKN